MPAPPHGWPVRVPIEAEDAAKVEAMASLVDEHSIVAGGAVRDLLIGSDPRDIDVFTSPQGEAEVRARAAEQVGADMVALAATMSAPSSSGSATGLRAVMNYGSIQVITVANPWERVYKFDAYCNMVWVDWSGTVWAASSRVLEHIVDRVWAPNQESVMTADEHERRRAKFLERGWRVHTDVGWLTHLQTGKLTPAEPGLGPGDLFPF